MSLLSRDDHYKLCKVTLLSVRITILYPVSSVLQPHHHSLTLRTAPPLIFMKLKMTEGFVPEDFRFLFSNSDSPWSDNDDWSLLLSVISDIKCSLKWFVVF